MYGLQEYGVPTLESVETFLVGFWAVTNDIRTCHQSGLNLYIGECENLLVVGWGVTNGISTGLRAELETDCI